MKRIKAIPMVLCLSILFTHHLFGAELKVSADLELFYERSKEIKGENNNDQFKTNGLYFIFEGSFENNASAKLKVDGSDMVSKDGDLVTENFIEEANFTLKNISDSPLTLVFGKDEMPFGQDYDKYLTDPLTNKFEVDKVWAVHVIYDINNFGNLAAALYDSDGNEITDNFATKLTVNKLVTGLTFEVSMAFETYEPGSDTIGDEMRYSLGACYSFPEGLNLYTEYTGFSNRKGVKDHDPSVITLGAEYTTAPFKIFARFEYLDAGDIPDTENNFYMAGVSYEVAPKFTIALEASNYNTGNLSDASDGIVAEGSLEPAVVFGMRAIF